MLVLKTAKAMGVPARSADTTADAERVQIALLRAAPIGRRLQLAFSLSATVIGMARRALATSHPTLSAMDHNLLFVEIHYGRDLAAGMRAELERRVRVRAGCP